MPDHFIKLSCSNCGGELDIYDDMHRFSCGTCGMKVIADRRGGTVSLRPAEAVRTIQIPSSRPTGAVARTPLAEEEQRQRKVRIKETLRRTKWGFGIGGAVLLMGLVASKTVRSFKTRSVRRMELSPALTARIDTVRVVLAEVYPMSKQQWLDSLRRGINPEKEVLWWERVGGCFTAFAAKRTLSPNQRQAVFKVIFGLCSGLREQDFDEDLAKLPPSARAELASAARSLAR